MPDESTAALCEAVDRFAADCIDDQAIDKAGQISPDLLGALAEMGLFGLSIPEAYGGLGLSLAQSCEVCATLAKHDRSVATTVGLHAGLGSRPLVSRGDAGLKARLLPQMAAGKAIAAFATTEPDAGSDLTAIRTRAVPDGQGFRVNGSKIFVTNGGIAKVFTIACATSAGGKRTGQALFVLDKTDDGLVVGPEEDKLGLRGSSTTTLSLDGVWVPTDRRIDGADGVSDALAYGRTLMAGGCVGTARAALDAAVRHARVRHQFRRPLVGLEVVQSQLAEAAGLVFAMSAVVQQAGLATELELASIAAKVACSEGAWELCDLAVQLHGGAGYIEETGVALLLRDTRVTRIFEGANDVLRIRLGLGFAMAPPPWTAPNGPVGQLAGSLWSTVTDAAAAAARTHGVRLALRHALLHRLGDAAVVAMTAAAVADRAANEPDLALVYLERAQTALRRLTPSEPLVARGPIALRLAEVTP